jgi:PAS domain S-box-containing protein
MREAELPHLAGADATEDPIARYRSLVEFHPDGVYSLDLAGRYRSVNPAVTRLTGFSADEILGQTLAHLVVERDLERAWEAFRRAATGEPSSTELSVRRKCGDTIAVQVTKIPIVVDGKVVGVYGVAKDVTDQLRAQETLREAQQRLDALLAASPLAIFTLDARGHVGDWSEAAVRIFGWTREEVSGRLLPIVPEPQRAQFLELLGAVRSGRTLTGVEIRRQRRDGSMVDLSLSAAPMRDARGEVTGVLAMAVDITERKLLEQQFQQAQKMEAVGRLAGGVAHDFNNLLTAIQFNCETLLDDLAPHDPHRGEVQGTLEAAQRAAGLTRQLLAFSRKQIFEPKVLDLNHLVSNLEPMLRRLIGEDIRVTTALARDLGKVEADPNQLEQVVLNLVLNARDAMPAGGRVTIETANAELDAQCAVRHGVTAPASRYVQLAISDTGHGMDADTLARIFEPFFSTKGARGTGLGLSTVYGTITQSGGAVWAYSEPGQGTAFKIYLPRVDAPVESSPRSARDGRGGLTPAATTAVGVTPARSEGSETILLVEDEDAVRQVVRRILTRYGYTVLAASDGREALRIAEEHGGPIQLLVTDVVMPEMGGRELADRLLALRPSLRVLFTSGYTDDDILRRGVLLPGTAFLQKPFTADRITQKVREVLR